VGIKGMTTNEEDNVKLMLNVSTHDYLLFFTNKGKVYRIKGYEIPEFSRQSKGIPVINLLPIEKDEKITSVIPIASNEENVKSLIFFTKNGLTKRTELSEFDSIRKNGKLAINLKDDDELIAVEKTNGSNEIIISSSAGRMVRFDENEVRLMGRNTSGVRGIEMTDAYVVGAGVVEPDELVLTLTEKGYGKKTDVNEYRLTHRGGKGVKALNITEKNGNIVTFKLVKGDEDMIITTNEGVVIRLDVSKISTMGRSTQGVKLITLKDNQKVTSSTIVDKTEEDETEIDNITEESLNSEIEEQ
jgi:DNA gyrase subunit A